MSGHGRIAVAGAGELGTAVIAALVKASYPVTVLTRSREPKDHSFGASADVKYATVDYKSSSSLADALRGHIGLVSTVTATATGEQTPMIEAAIQAGVQRFFPADFGADTANKQTRCLPVFGYKVAMEEKLIEVAAANPRFTYTIVRNGLFFDWAMKYGFLLDLNEWKATIFDEGDQPFSATRIPTVAKAVVGVFQHLDETKNRAVYVHETLLTQNDLIAIAKSVDSKKAEWSLDWTTTAETKAEAFSLLSSGKDIDKAMTDMIRVSVYGKENGGDFTGKTDNKLLGIPELTRKEVQDLVAEYL